MKEIYILANGAMASALAFGLKDSYSVTIVGRTKFKLASLAEQGFKTLLYDEFNAKDKILILAFKPYALQSVASKIKDEARLIISVLANTDLKTLSCFKAQNYARIMPNMAAKFKTSTTPFILQNDQFKEEILEILNTFGKAVELDNEEQMNAAMAISGCAPAFLAMIAESIANGGVYQGLNKNLSYELTQGIFESLASLLKHEHPAMIKEQICSPAGVTIKGVKILEDHKLRSALMQAIITSSS
ncbi:pyrroline-5-carboxylate reductase [Campylobacter sp. MIT 99-7217]|uniref:pyrroline-5-carboxylate reductase n=1 Tax=Campylobacter sp. MIT 99-7217 TaxID=535091 RepID=UPI001159B383|nr:pyrroline-5-carboxylate reductase [Campylobacter sp. MIT 99-7217]TQR34549.1 pyrroline-5-carboxylate reductase [Campylobacter sp. MIT 99-7217]